MRLTLVRHAQATHPGNPPVADFDRPLTPHGRKGITELAAELAQVLPPPDRTVASPALRTHQTATLLHTAFGLSETAVSPAPDLYEAPPQRILAEVQAAPPETGHLLVVGHNPGVSILAHQLSTSDDLPPFSPGTVVSFRALGGSWKTLSAGTCEPDIVRFPA